MPLPVVVDYVVEVRVVPSGDVERRARCEHPVITLAYAGPRSILLIAAMKLRISLKKKVTEDRTGVDILRELQIDVLVSRGIVE